MYIRWKLGHVYDLTEYFNNLVKEGKIIGVDESYQHGYFVCNDVLDTHIYRIQVGINAEYDEEPETKIIETENISHYDLLDFCIEKYDIKDSVVELMGNDSRKYVERLIIEIGIESVLKALVEIDYERGFENYDVNEYRYNSDLSELIADIDGGYGISKIEM